MNTSDPRFLIAASRLILARNGCESQVAGQVSSRAIGEEAFWISTFGYFDESRPEDTVKIRFDLSYAAGSGQASPALQFHAAIFQERPDVQCVIHTHSHWVSVLSSAHRTIGMYNVGSVLFYNDQVLHVDDGSATALDGKLLAAKLGDKRVILMKNHGCIIASQSIEQATIEALTLEQAARYDIECRAAGGTEIPEVEVLRGRGQYHKYYVPQMWLANMRRLRKSDPELFEGITDADNK